MGTNHDTSLRLQQDEDKPTVSVIKRNAVQPVECMQRCQVCDRFTIGTHYRAAVCGGCASFFRRTVVNDKSYPCTCRMPFRNKKKGCRRCRFNSCLKAGMDAKVVQAVKSFPTTGDTLLSQILACRNRMYVTRGLLFQETDAERMQNPRWLMLDLSRGRSFEYLCYVEHRGLTQFWTDFLRCSSHFQDIASPMLLTNHFLAIWVALEYILATVAHGRIDKETCLADYETTMSVNYDWFYALYGRYAKFAGGPALIATLSLEHATRVLHMSRIVQRASLDNQETTAVLLFLIAHYEREMFVDDASVKTFVNQVLRELHDHYKSTYHSYDERLGVIVSVVGEFHRLISLHEQYFTQLSLCTKGGQGMQLPSQKETVNSLYDLRRSIKT